MNKSKAPQYSYDEKSGLFSNFETEAKRELRRDTYLAVQSLKKKVKEEEMELLREENDARTLQLEKERKGKELKREILRLEAAKAKTLREEHESRLQSEIEKLSLLREQRKYLAEREANRQHEDTERRVLQPLLHDHQRRRKRQVQRALGGVMGGGSSSLDQTSDITGTDNEQSQSSSHSYVYDASAGGSGRERDGGGERHRYGHGHMLGGPGQGGGSHGHNKSALEVVHESPVQGGDVEEEDMAGAPIPTDHNGHAASLSPGGQAFREECGLVEGDSQDEDPQKGQGQGPPGDSQGKVGVNLTQESEDVGINESELDPEIGGERGDNGSVLIISDQSVQESILLPPEKLGQLPLHPSLLDEGSATSTQLQRQRYTKEAHMQREAQRNALEQEAEGEREGISHPHPHPYEDDDDGHHYHYSQQPPPGNGHGEGAGGREGQNSRYIAKHRKTRSSSPRRNGGWGNDPYQQSSQQQRRRQGQGQGYPRHHYQAGSQKKPPKQFEKEKYAKLQQSRENKLMKERIAKARSSGYGYRGPQELQVPIVKQQGPRIVKERNPLVVQNQPQQGLNQHQPHAPLGVNGDGFNPGAKVSPRRQRADKASGRGRGRKRGGGGRGRNQGSDRPRAPDYGGGEWHEVPIELNSLVIPSPTHQYQHRELGINNNPGGEYLDPEQRDLLNEYEQQHGGSTSGLYALDATNNGGGSIVSIGINDDGSVTVLNPEQHAGQQQQEEGRHDGGREANQGFHSHSHPHSNEGEGGGDMSLGNGSSNSGLAGQPGFPENDQSSLLYYDIPGVNTGSNKDGVLGPAEETFDAVLNASNLRNDYGIDGAGFGDNNNPGGVDHEHGFGGINESLSGDNAGLEYHGSIEQSSVRITSWDDDGGDEVGEGVGGATSIPLPSWHKDNISTQQQQQQQQQQLEQQDHFPVQQHREEETEKEEKEHVCEKPPEGQDDSCYSDNDEDYRNDTDPAYHQEYEGEEEEEEEEEEGILYLSRSNSDVHLKHDHDQMQVATPRLEPRRPTVDGNSNSGEDEDREGVAPAVNLVVERNREMKRQPSDDETPQLERNLKEFTTTAIK